MIKLVLTDLDDTLICHGRPCATEHARAGIHALLDAGVRFGPVSGRIPSDFGWMFDGDEACFATAAPVNGQMVYVDGDLVHVEVLDGDELNRLARVLCDVPDACLALYDLDVSSEAGSGYFVSPDGGHAHDCMQLFHHFHRFVEELDEPTYVKANVWCSGSRAHITEVRNMLRTEFPRMDFVFPSATAPIIDISPAGWSKGSAVRYLAQTLGLTVDEIAVFGDSENDLSMIEAVSNSVAVSNATDEVMQASRWHIGASADDAVADALFQIAEASRYGEMPVFMRA